ncbi:hypothetical protein [Citrobacter youngae]|uniref:hypothetical protein n=1 Tax=Citrobacter youngae TaxID=133448 RepID=UPI00397AC524
MREILISESAWEEMTCLFAPSLNNRKTKIYMNKPNDILPTGEFGVVNEYCHSTLVQPARHNEIYNTETPNLQWGMPKPLNV